MPALPAKTNQIWAALRQAGQFDEQKAFASLIALDVSQVKYPPTLAGAVDSEAPTLATVKKYHGEELALESLAEIIAEGAALLNIGKNLQPHQIEFLATEIMQQYHYLKLSEIRFLVKQGIGGKYGELYDRLDVQVFFSWVSQYDDQRTAFAEGRNDQKRREVEAGNAKPMPEWFAEFIRKFEDKEAPKTDFTPDAAFWEMVEQEWNELPGERMEYSKFKAMRLAQTKAIFAR